jgi:hypothetical protein
LRSIEKLIAVARERSGNIDYGYDKSTGAITSGLTQDFFVEAAKEAQLHLQQQIIAIKADLFLTNEETSLVANTETYALSGRLFGDTKVKAIQYSADGNSINYLPLRQATFAERDSSSALAPEFYIPQANVIYLNPITTVSAGKIRTTYYRQVDDLDIRRGSISGTPSGTSIILSATNCFDYDLGLADYICVNNQYGDVLLYGGKISSYNSTTHTLTLAANVSTYLVSGYTLANLASQYVTIGRYSTTHSKLPDVCEPYLKTYMQKRAYNRNQHTGSLFEDQELTTMRTDILSAYSEKTEDVTEVPILDPYILL